jgi:hypothetical protein
MTTTTEIDRRPEEKPEEAPALADLDLPEESAGEVTGGTRGGGCDDEFGCGSNHNEMLAVTA